MRIGVIDFAASTGGAITILRSFYEYLLESANQDEWYFFLSDNYITETENIHIVLLKQEKNSRFRRLLFDRFYGRRVIRRYNLETIFYLQNTFINGINCPQVAYMDQPIPFQDECEFSFFNHEQRGYAIYQHIIGYFIKAACKKADTIIVQTRWMKESIERKCHINGKKIFCIPALHDLKILAEDKQQSISPDFFYPANKMYYKNHRCINQAVQILKSRGYTDFNVEYTLQENEFDNLPNQIHCLGWISHESVSQKLKNDVLVFPSYVESYGLPLAECKTQGGMVLAADTAFAREILNGYPNVRYFRYDRPSELADLMADIIDGNLKKVKLSIEKSGQVNTWKYVVNILESYK